jgi:hypothetical protein
MSDHSEDLFIGLPIPPVPKFGKERVSGSVIEVAALLAAAYRELDEPYRKRLYATLANVYGLALFMMNYPDQWHEFCRDMAWGSDQAPRAEEIEDAIHWTLVRVMGEGKAQRGRISKYGNILRVLHEEKCPPSAAAELIEKKGIEKTSRSEAKARTKSKQAILGEESVREASSSSMKNQRAIPMDYANLEEDDDEVDTGEGEGFSSRGDAPLTLEASVVDERVWRELEERSSEEVTMYGRLSGSAGTGFRFDVAFVRGMGEQSLKKLRKRENRKKLL